MKIAEARKIMEEMATSNPNEPEMTDAEADAFEAKFTKLGKAINNFDKNTMIEFDKVYGSFSVEFLYQVLELLEFESIENIKKAIAEKEGNTIIEINL